MINLNEIQLKPLFEHYNSIVFFDFETTGFQPSQDDIIEVGAVQLLLTEEGSIIYHEFGTLINLSKRNFIPSKITEITGITSAMLKQDGINILHAKELLYEMMSKETKTLIIAHNALFDLGFLVELFKDKKEFLSKLDVLDTLTIFKDRHPYPHKLSDAITQYGLTGIVKNSHRAIDDVNSLVSILIAMADEESDLDKYINLIGYNPKYPPHPLKLMPKLKYLAQPYSAKAKLYELIKIA